MCNASTIKKAGLKENILQHLQNCIKVEQDKVFNEDQKVETVELNQWTSDKKVCDDIVVKVQPKDINWTYVHVEDWLNQWITVCNLDNQVETDFRSENFQMFYIKHLDYIMRPTI